MYFRRRDLIGKRKRDTERNRVFGWRGEMCGEAGRWAPRQRGDVQLGAQQLVVQWVVNGYSTVQYKYSTRNIGLGVIS